MLQSSASRRGRGAPDGLGAHELGELLPTSLRPYAPLIADALWFFLDALPAPRRAMLLREQAALPPGASVARRLFTLLRACPTLHKLGQVLARQRALPAELREWLQQLETLAGGPQTPLLAARLAEERDVLERLAGLRIGSCVLAEGSVAWIVPCEFSAAAPAAGRGLHPGDEPGGSIRAVLKILKPDAVRWLHEELEVWTRLGAFLDESCVRYALPALQYEEVFATLRALLLSEVDVAGEQANLAAAARRYANSSGLRVPRLLPGCSAGVTVMERLAGVRLPDAMAGADERRRLAALTVRGLLADALWHVDSESVFHADPHAGNLLHLEEGGVGVLDWSLTGRLDKPSRVALTHVLLAALRWSPAALAEALAGLSPFQSHDHAALLRVAAAGLARLSRRPIPGVAWLTGLLDEAVRDAGLRVPPELLLFRKTLLTLEGVLADLAPDWSVDAELLGALLERLARESPQRWLAALEDDRFSTHISTGALWRLAWESPLCVARWWEWTRAQPGTQR